MNKLYIMFDTDICHDQVCALDLDSTYNAPTVKHTSNVPLDVVFVTAPKDFETLAYSVNSVKELLQQPINKMVLISPHNQKAIEISKALGMEYIPEDSILNHNEFIKWTHKNKLSNNAGGWNWYYQQFLKILYYKISQSNDYFVIDSDIVLNKPLTLVSNEGHRTFFVGYNSGHEISKTSIKFLLGEEQYVPEFSYIADLMCFNKKIVEKMVDKIETKFNTKFHKAAILVEQNTAARFSEYEMYGVYANFLKDEKLLDTSINLPTPPYSTCIRARENISTDRSVSELQKCAYLAYHTWVPQRNKKG